MLTLCRGSYSLILSDWLSCIYELDTVGNGAAFDMLFAKYQNLELLDLRS